MHQHSTPHKTPDPAIDQSSVTLKDKVVFNEQLELGNKENKKERVHKQEKISYIT